MDFHEPGFAVALSGENRGGGGQLYRGGPLLPQALNRYSYTLNNPLLYVDPSGHQSLVEYAAILLLIYIVAAVSLSGTQSVGQAVRNPPSMAGEPASPPQPTPPPGFDPARYRDLGTDRTTGQFRDWEADTAARLESRDPSIHLRRLDPKTD